MKRNHLIRLQGSDVFSAPPSLGIKTVPQSFTILDGLVARGLSVQSFHYAQNTIGETLEFTDWVQKVLKKNGESRRRRYYRESKKSSLSTRDRSIDRGSDFSALEEFWSNPDQNRMAFLSIHLED